jgi:outer membrane receptor for ferric coprogen and ferric-rhodotorulic acid
VVDRGVRNSGTLNNVRIRGVNVDSAQLGDYVPAGAAAISSYVNDTPIFANFLLKDVGRVEVLRGPQGTLYGRGSMGGTVRYILRDPVIVRLRQRRRRPFLHQWLRRGELDYRRHRQPAGQRRPRAARELQP